MNDTMTLREILEAAGHDVKPYSGRGMGGDECISVTSDAREPIGAIFADCVDFCDGDRVTLRIVSAAFRNARTDSLGRSTVVYFPTVRA